MAHSDRKTTQQNASRADRIWQSLEFSIPREGNLIGGPGLSVEYLVRHKWKSSSQIAEHTQLVFLLGNSACDLSWWITSRKKQSHRMLGGGLCIVDAGVRYRFCTIAKTELLVLHLGNQWLSQFAPMDLNRVSVESVFQLAVLDPLIGGLISTLTGEVSGGSLHKGQIGALGHCLASRVVRAQVGRLYRPQRYQRKLSTATIERVANYVATHLGESIDFRLLAREARLSLSHFGVLFKATVGLTPEQYILHMRLLKAKNLIISGDYTIGDVAYRTGFADHSHLSVQFKRVFGAPPKAYLPLVRRV